MKRSLLFAAAVILLFAVGGVDAQRKAKTGKICGDPTLPCKAAENFQPFDLAFDTGKNFVIADSDWFYGIVLKSKKVKNYGDCENPSYAEPERSSVQELFPHNKVFTQNCVESGTNYYAGVAQETAFIGVYAGKTLAEANRVLKTVQATKKFPGIRVRRMQAGINGT